MQKVYVIVFSTLISVQVFALDLQEKIRGVVLKIYPENVVALSIGVEDGVRFQDHIKFSNNGTFFARGLCIKTLPKVSFWKIYRTTKGAIQQSFQYELVSIPLSEVRPSVLREVSSIKLDFLQSETQENLLKNKNTH